MTSASLISGIVRISLYIPNVYSSTSYHIPIMQSRQKSYRQGFPLLSARPHPAPFLESVPCRAPPDTAHSHFYWGGAAFAKGSWRALESPVLPGQKCLYFLPCRQPWLRAKLCHLQRTGIDGEAEGLLGRLPLGQSHRQRTGETIARGSGIYDLYCWCGLVDKARLSLLASCHKGSSLRPQRDSYCGDSLPVESYCCHTRILHLVYLLTCEHGNLCLVDNQYLHLLQGFPWQRLRGCEVQHYWNSG